MSPKRDTWVDLLGTPLSKVQGKDPGEIRAESQDGTQQHTKRRSVAKGRNGKVRKVKRRNKDIGKRD